MTERVQGLVLGEVTDVEDPEALGRIKAKYFAIKNEPESDWMPIAFPMAGADNGFLAMPSVGDQVVIGFTYGDVNAPVALGFIWDGDHAPPVEPAKERVWKSVNGHSLTLSDEDPDGIVLEDAHGNKITMNADGITIETQGELKISAQSSAEVDSPGTVTVKGNPIELNP